MVLGGRWSGRSVVKASSAVVARRRRDRRAYRTAEDATPAMRRITTGTMMKKKPLLNLPASKSLVAKGLEAMSFV